MTTPNWFLKASWRCLGAAEPPIAIVRSEAMFQPSFSHKSFTAIQIVGTAPVKVTFSFWTSSQMSRGWGFGPAKIWVDPTITPVNGRHQALAWNMGTMCRTVSSSEIPNESVSASPRQCRNIARCVYTTPFGLPVVPEV